MNWISEILAAPSIDLEGAAALLAAYPGISELLAGIAMKREATNRNVTIRPFTADDVVKGWSASLDIVLVGLVHYEASGMSQFGRTSVCINKRSGTMVLDDW